jgi:hypothetical protein
VFWQPLLDYLVFCAHKTRPSSIKEEPAAFSEAVLKDKKSAASFLSLQPHERGVALLKKKKSRERTKDEWL